MSTVWLSVPEVTRQLPITISEYTVRRWTREGRLPARRIGGRWYYKPEEIAKALKHLISEEIPA